MLQGNTQCSIFIGNIPYTANEDQLQEVFETVGPVVSLRILRDENTGQAKGIGFCEYRDEASAERAIRILNNYEMNGRCALLVSPCVARR
jgi:RNA recognition motif-containing protein